MASATVTLDTVAETLKQIVATEPLEVVVDQSVSGEELLGLPD
jgi:hypothetical protein